MVSTLTISNLLLTNLVYSLVFCLLASLRAKILRSSKMDPPRIERGPVRCKRAVLPLDYGPLRHLQFIKNVCSWVPSRITNSWGLVGQFPLRGCLNGFLMLRLYAVNGRLLAVLSFNVKKWNCFLIFLYRRWSIRRFPYGYLVTT